MGSVLALAAHAQDLPAVWQRKVQQLANNIAKSRQALATGGAADLQDAFKTKQWHDRIANYQSSLARVPPSSDPLLVSAKEALEALEAEFSALETDVSNTASPDPAPAAARESTTGASAQTTGAASTREPQLVSGQRVRVKKLARDMSGVAADIVTTGPSPMQSGEIVGKYNRSLQQFGSQGD